MDSTKLPINERPFHPKYGKALSGQETVIDGVTFYPYRAGILGYVRASHDGRIVIQETGRTGEVFSCSVDGARLPKTFRKFETAARAGIAKAKGG